MLRAVASQILSGTWANKPASAALGSLYFASDVGEQGTVFQYGVSRWRVFGGTATLKQVGSAITVNNSEDPTDFQVLLPAGVLQAGDVIRIENLSLTKSGTTDGGSLTVRMGTAGTTGDTAITGMSAYSIMATTSVTGGFTYDIKVVSATSVQKIGSAANQSTGFGGPSTAAIVTATTISDVSANAIYISVSPISTGATNTINLTGGAIQLITP